MAEKNTIQKMREATWRGSVDQNGNNPFFYRMYDEKGRVVATKEGITTTPTELAPRERLVKRELDAFVPLAEDKTVRPKAFIQPKS